MKLLSILASASALVAPMLVNAAPAVAERSQIYVNPESIKISAPVSNAPEIKLVSTPTLALPRSTQKPTLALNRDRKPLYYTSVTSTSWTTVETTTTKNVGTTTTSSTTTTKPVTTTTTTTKPASTTSKPRTTSSTPSPSPSPSPSSEQINAVYYPDWTAQQIPPESVDYSLFDILYFCESRNEFPPSQSLLTCARHPAAFAIPAQDFSLYFTQWNSVDILQRLIKNGHANGKKVCITIGGWTGSQYFSTAVENSANRETFAQNIANMVSLYGADGVDIDWEYPGQSGASGNIVQGGDTANLLTFLALLRQKLGSSAIISLATPLNVWYDSTGAPSTDVSAFAQYIDHVLLMNYDVWGASSNPGPNAPMNYCGNSWQPGSNAVNAVKNWKAAGMPANKIMLGLPSYGYVSDSTATTLIHKRSRQMDAMVARRHAAEARSNMYSGNMRPRLQGSMEKRSDLEARQSNGDISSFWNSQLEFNQLVQYGVLQRNGMYDFSGINGFTRAWDSCSSTPYLYNVGASTVVTYDDPVSLNLKAQFAKDQGLRGTGMWDISGDTANWDLVKATRQGLGLSI